MYYSEADQDKFAINISKGKKNGFFLEIGSSHPILKNNTYILESQLDWNGIMVEYDDTFLPLYKEYRPNSVHIINDATKIDYKKLLEDNNAPLNIDYLQIDLEVDNGSTLQTLEKMDAEIFDTYKFATITFEHDLYKRESDNDLYEYTRIKSREIFKNRGYICLFQDISLGFYPRHLIFEDWYIHPELVDMDYIVSLCELNNKHIDFSDKYNTTFIHHCKIEYYTDRKEKWDKVS